MARGHFNPARGDVKVTIAEGEIELTLRYTLRAMQHIQSRIGADSMDRLLGEGANALGDLNTFEVLVDAGMIYHHGLRAEHGIDVLAECTGTDLEALGAAITQCFIASFPKKAEPAAGEGGSERPTSPALTSTS